MERSWRRSDVRVRPNHVCVCVCVCEIACSVQHSQFSNLSFDGLHIFLQICLHITELLKQRLMHQEVDVFAVVISFIFTICFLLGISWMNAFQDAQAPACWTNFCVVCCVMCCVLFVKHNRNQAHIKRIEMG